MDELRAFFNSDSSTNSQVIKLRSPLTNGFRITKDDNLNQMNRREEHRRTFVSGGTDYAREVKQRETELYVKNELERENDEEKSVGLNAMEHLSIGWTSNQDELSEEAMTQMYNKYSFQIKEDTINLAIIKYKNKILEIIKSSPVVVIEGPTGCGKTTQVPQWILDQKYNERQRCKIIVTQPRRIAAISIAKRVAQERGWEVGGVVGYQVGLENRTSSDTCIQYVTTGVLLQKLVAAKTMNEFTHVILDEVHERGQEMDFLLLIVKKLLYTQSPHVKVILMSATFNRKAFADYFLTPTPNGSLKSASVEVEKKEQYSVKIYYLNHLKKFLGEFKNLVNKSDEPSISPEMYHLVIKLVNAFERIDKHEENYTNRSEADLPSILIFLPGINEIEELYICLTDPNLRSKMGDVDCVKYDWWVVPLHSTITADEQARVFQRAPLGSRKIILSTNIAESSITVPDIKYVIDFCLMKISVADENTNFTSLQLSWASKTNCEQRAGRAGRVREGRVYRLVYDKFYENLPMECSPEIMRCSLERLVLLAKMLDMGSPRDILALAMNPPDLSNIQRTVLVLKEVGALKKTLNGKWSPSDGDITYLGYIMAKLPLDVRVSKLIMLGYIYGCLDECIIMAAAMSVKSVFSSPFRERLNAYNSKLTWADGSTSDCIAFLNVYKVWQHLRQQQYFKQQGNNETQWARRFYVQVRALRELDDLVRELRVRLSRENIESLKGNSPWDSKELPLVLKVLLAGACYPQYFVQLSQDESREREAVRTLGGLDPRNTVYLKDFPDNQPGEIYATAIKNVLKNHIGDEPCVTFDKNSRKVFLTFTDNEQKSVGRGNKNSGDPTIPGQVLLPVYKAVKCRQLKIDIRIPLLSQEKAKALAAALESKKLNVNVNEMVPRLPELDDTHFPLKISQVVSVSKFWVQYDDESTASELRTIHKLLNQSPLLAFTDTLSGGELLAAPYTDANNTAMYRVRVTKLLPRNMVEVSYIDYGSYGRVNACNLRVLPGACGGAPLAMCCALRGLAPAPLLDPHGNWSRTATLLFHQLTSNTRLIGKVYSVVRGVVSIELLSDGGRLSINKELIKKGVAIPCEESYESKLNHDLRQTATELNMTQKRAYNKEQTNLAFRELREVAPPNAKDCVCDVSLKGPFSPLETRLYNMMYTNHDKEVTIEWNSVNSVLLDTEPQEVYERLLVAMEVGQNEINRKLTLRHTTLMPNIPGLPAIIALLFCPVSELRRCESGSRYVSVLCGLGGSDDGAPLFSEHDLLINIDADITIDDIGLINHMRHLMDYMIYSNNETQLEPILNTDFRPRVPHILREDFLKLLMKRRKHREPQSVPNAWNWKSAPEDELLEISAPDMLECSVIYPLHAPLELYPLSREQMLALKQENDRLKLLVSRSSLVSNQEVVCQLCGTTPMSVKAMRIHLYSNAHKEKEEDFRLVQS